jgi:hypothetical protein
MNNNERKMLKLWKFFRFYGREQKVLAYLEIFSIFVSTVHQNHSQHTKA